MTRIQQSSQNHALAREASKPNQKKLPPADKPLDSYISAGPLPKDGLVSLSSGGIQYGPVEGELFINGATFDDVRQGAIGDCYFVSSLSAIAEADPQWISGAIQSNPDNTFTVRFFRRGKPVYVTVDNEFLHSKSGRLVLGSSTDKGELWVAVMEKAYAKWKGGYQNIGQGGNPATALSEITGVSSRLILDAAISEESLYSKLQTMLEHHEAVVAGTYSGPHNVYTKDHLVTSHAYTILGVKEEDGQKYVVLRNPWGNTEWNGEGADKKNDGIFKMPIEAFRNMFNVVAHSTSPLSSYKTR